MGAFSFIPIVGPMIDAAIGLGATKSQVHGATESASQIEKYNREAQNYLTGRAQQGRNDILEQNAQGRDYLNPYFNSGVNANTTLQNEVMDGSLNRPFSLSDLQLDPGYNFRQQQGEQGVQRNAAARTGVQNGGVLKALERYRQGFASNELNNAYGRFRDSQNMRANQLMGLSGEGLQAGQQAGNMDQQTGTSLLNQSIPLAELGGRYITDIGDAQAGARAARGQAYGNYYNSIAGDAYGTASNLLQRRIPNVPTGMGPGTTDLRPWYDRSGNGTPVATDPRWYARSHAGG